MVGRPPIRRHRAARPAVLDACACEECRAAARQFPADPPQLTLYPRPASRPAARPKG